ncbi:hypothetical protein GY14_06385 [Delftia tsuruhatensis]|uniref:DUF4405 domain-containing protein n=1 Tax=Delftia tsuruhatensis TaxID=180282 RepID=A0ABM6EAX3_9BURK|nr:hypothetical protein BI380_27070 [Delftia tsuruhatensis]KEH10337.1 hypothetical protein GY14_06385 [Delftia tsuruhatensis]
MVVDMIWLLRVIKHNPTLSHIIGMFIVCHITQDTLVIYRYRLRTCDYIWNTFKCFFKISINLSIYRT